MGATGDEELRALVRRVAGRVLAERGNAPHGGPHAERPHAAGVHVRVGPAPGEGACTSPAASVPRPGASARSDSATGSGQEPAAERARPGREVVTARCLRHTPDGGRFAAPPGAIVTALARDEAHRRRITIVEGTGVAPLGGEAGSRVAVGADHGGFELKQAVVEWLRELGYRPLDLGTHDATACDYPDFAHAVALAVAEGRADLGVCVDGAGIGSCMTANKVPGVLAAACTDEALARNAREHNHANVLTLGARLAPAAAQGILRAFLATPVGPGRHARRVEKIRAIEARYRTACACGGRGEGCSCGGAALAAPMRSAGAGSAPAGSARAGSTGAGWAGAGSAGAGSAGAGSTGAGSGRGAAGASMGSAEGAKGGGACGYPTA